MEMHLNSFGARLRVREGLFEVHYRPKGKGWKKQQVAAIRVSSIYMMRHTSLSVEAAME